MKSVCLVGKIKSVNVGDQYPMVVNCNVGSNNRRGLNEERRKIDILFSKSETTPDLMMDLSIPYFGEESLYRYIIDKYGVPVGTIPIYNLYHEGKSISDRQLLGHIELLAKTGISFLTIHFTADNDIFSVAKRSRGIPVTSRGGAVVLKENYGKRCDKLNIYRRNIDEIINLAKEYDITISLGSTFRPASILDACDEAHIMETKRQIELCHYLQSQGVSVMLENVGHIAVDKIVLHSELLKQADAPIMPLGPSVMDSALGQDHVAAAIGAAFMGYYGVAHIVNAISPAEHLTSLFTIEDAIEAVKATKTAVQSVNLTRFKSSHAIEAAVYKERTALKSCLLDQTTACFRCKKMCPLKLIDNEN